jgi:regulatory protein
VAVKPPRAKPQRSLKARALQWLAQREQSRAELRRKLMPHAVAEAAAAESSAASDFHDSAGSSGAERESAATRVEAVLDWLEAHKYLSNERFAESRVHARASRFGNLRIRQELKQHQVALAPEVASALASSELQRARDVLSRRYSEPPATPTERAKRARFLAARGFSPNVIGRALRTPSRRDEDIESMEAGLD